MKVLVQLYDLCIYLNNSYKKNLFILLIILLSSICSPQAQTFNFQDDSSMAVSDDDSDSKDISSDNIEKVKHWLSSEDSQNVIFVSKNLKSNEEFENTDCQHYLISLSINSKNNSYLFRLLTSFIFHRRKKLLYEYNLVNICEEAITTFYLNLGDQNYILSIGSVEENIFVKNISLLLIRDRSPGLNFKQNSVHQINNTKKPFSQKILKHPFHQTLKTYYLYNRFVKLFLEKHVQKIITPEYNQAKNLSSTTNFIKHWNKSHLVPEEINYIVHQSILSKIIYNLVTNVSIRKNLKMFSI